MFSIKTQIRKKFIGTDSRSKKMYKNTVAMIGIRGVSMILTLISAPIMLHHVDRADYGVLLTLTSIVGWVGYMDVGLGNGLRNKLPEFLAKGDFHSAKKIVSSCYVWTNKFNSICLSNACVPIIVYLRWTICCSHCVGNTGICV